MSQEKIDELLQLCEVTPKMEMNSGMGGGFCQYISGGLFLNLSDLNKTLW